MKDFDLGGKPKLFQNLGGMCGKPKLFQNLGGNHKFYYKYY
ncbi:unnamed protein product [Brassica oleracea var. botrytis]|uniref:(rape) hypothetical protein n=1 Tax=Brassica napus TaxID=3708 RepID=A0A816LP60_BRANA|nr:unnamed protein product [Brassica napus]